MGTAGTRQYKINWLIGHISAAMKAGRIVDKEKLIGAFCIDLASSRKTAKEILRDLELAGRIKVLGNEIWTSEYYDLDDNLNIKHK
ncbi:unnamed protein product [marine sediment metagenome]|uniref:Uncharacterized protein n=1 Tax=marine sediment metagenome TaxID=412755 RepID=X1S533_9ZZZZ